MELRTKLLSFGVAFLCALTAMAPAASADDPSFLSVSVGWYDIDDDDQAVDLRAEYRSKAKFLGFVKPWVGVEITSDIAAYGAVGILTDIFFGRRIVVTPSIGVGFYADGDGKDLGSAIEFRSQLELGYRFDDRSRLSAAVSHISNAGLEDTNPGANIVSLYYHIPLERF